MTAVYRHMMTWGENPHFKHTALLHCAIMLTPCLQWWLQVNFESSVIPKYFTSLTTSITLFSNLLGWSFGFLILVNCTICIFYRFIESPLIPIPHICKQFLDSLAYCTRVDSPGNRCQIIPKTLWKGKLSWSPFNSSTLTRFHSSGGSTLWGHPNPLSTCHVTFWSL